jgi:NADH:ubiquinone oxidoreductase subunit 2 (subunit N)
METGYSLLAISIKGTIGIEIFFGLLIPRTIALFLWAMALSIILSKTSSDHFSEVKGLGRKYPFAAMIIILTNLSLAGIPLLAGFPIHQALWENVGTFSLTNAIWFLAGTTGLLMGGIRSLAVLVAPSEEIITIRENWAQRIFLSLGILAIILLGIFPQLISPFMMILPKLFSHLG